MVVVLLCMLAYYSRQPAFKNTLTVINGNYFFEKNIKFFNQVKIIYKCECIYAYMSAVT